MQLLDVKSLCVSAWNPKERTPIKIRRETDGSISLVTSDNSLCIVCGMVYVARVHPYGGKQNADARYRRLGHDSLLPIQRNGRWGGEFRWPL